MSDTTPTTRVTNHDSEPLRLALRPKDAARALGIGERLLWAKTNAGEIPHVRIGKAVLYPIADLERWLSAQAAGGRSART